MIWLYTVQDKELHVTDTVSLSKLNSYSNRFDWVWLDIFHPDEEESEIISELLGNEHDIVENLKKGTHNPLTHAQAITSHKRLHDYDLFFIACADLEEQLRIQL